MAYQDLEVSRQDAFPVELYKFTGGPAGGTPVYWYYTPFAKSCIYGGATYTPAAISSGAIVQDGEAPKNNIQVKLPTSNALAQLYLGKTPDFVVALNVFRTHYNPATGLLNAGGITKWMGRIVSSSASVGTVNLTCEPVLTSIMRVGLQATFQRSCIHRLYGPGCNVNKASFSTTRTVTGIVGNIITLNSPSVGSAYSGGRMRAPDGTESKISGVIPLVSAVTIIRPIQSLAVGQTVTISRGCDRSTATCASVFNNIGNFGGWPGIPYINPMSEISVIAR